MPQTAAFSAFTAPMASLVLTVPTVPVALLGCHSPGDNPQPRLRAQPLSGKHLFRSSKGGSPSPRSASCGWCGPHLLTFEESRSSYAQNSHGLLSPPILEGMESCLILSIFPSSKPLRPAALAFMRKGHWCLPPPSAWEGTESVLG